MKHFERRSFIPVWVGAQIHPQQASCAQMRDAWLDVEELGADTPFNWDNFFPLYGDPDGEHFECWTLLGAMAEVTERVEFGAVVACNSYRNPNLLADMARPVDHVSAGRHILGIGAGWFQRDREEYGYELGTAGDRLRALDAAMQVIKERLRKLNPLRCWTRCRSRSGAGKVTLRIVAEHAHIWNALGDPEQAGRKNRILDEWCQKVRRDPKEMECSVNLRTHQVRTVDRYVENGITHLMNGIASPDYDLSSLNGLISWCDEYRERHPETADPARILLMNGF